MSVERFRSKVFCQAEWGAGALQWRRRGEKTGAAEPQFEAPSTDRKRKVDCQLDQIDESQTSSKSSANKKRRVLTPKEESDKKVYDNFPG